MDIDSCHLNLKAQEEFMTRAMGLGIYKHC